MVSIISGKFLSQADVSEIMAPVVASRVPYALIGGAALAYHGCPRLISNVDIAVNEPVSVGSSANHRLECGGASFLDGKLKIIHRTDEYAKLYQDSILTAHSHPSGYKIASIEHIGAMKLSMREGHHRLDLEWVLLRAATNFRKLRDLVYTHVGGRFGVDFLEDMLAEAKMEASLDLDRGEGSYP